MDTQIKIEKKDILQGQYSLINNSLLISDCFLISSVKNINSLIKIINDKIIFCKHYKIEFENKEPCIIQKFIKK